MKNRIFFIFILTIVGVAIACSLTAIKEPQWKAGTKFQIYRSTYIITYPGDETTANAPRHSDNDFVQLTNLLKSDFLANHVIKAIEEHASKHGNVNLDTLKKNREISVSPKDYTVWFYYTCNDPQSARQIVTFYKDAMLKVVSDTIKSTPIPMLEILQVQINQMEDQISELQSQLKKLSLENSSERELTEKKIRDAEAMLAFVIKSYDSEKSRDRSDSMALVVEEAPRLISENPINKNYLIASAIGAICGLLIGLIVSKVFLPRNA